MSGKTNIMLLLITLLLSLDYTLAVRCYSCQYSENPSLIGYECVTSPADYTLGPTTVECGDVGCQTETQSINNWGSIWFILRGCKSKDDGCVGGAANICVDTCTGSDLCNDRNYAVSTLDPTATTPSTTTTTEIPGTRWCYSCVYSYHPEGDDRCVTDPGNVPAPSVVRCPPNRMCSIQRQYDKGEQVVRSFYRGCDEQYRPNGCVDDIYFTTCFTFCNDEFCNVGDGASPPRRLRRDRRLKP